MECSILPKFCLSYSGIVKIDDFQFLDREKYVHKAGSNANQTKQQMYLAPEHCSGKEADHRCDLFSSGVIAYKMLSGQHPFLEESRMDHNADYRLQCKTPV